MHNVAEFASQLIRRTQRDLIRDSGMDNVRSGVLYCTTDHVMGCQRYQVVFNSAFWTGRGWPFTPLKTR
jgi:hypothetical protein